MLSSGLTTLVQSCTTWPSVTEHALRTSPPTLSGLKLTSLVSNREVKRGINLRSVSSTVVHHRHSTHVDILESGQPVSVTIPSTLAAGDYLLRAEIISLQNAMSEGGAEFYPACIQLSVGGSQTGGPTGSETVTFPGGYSDQDPGILTPNVRTTFSLMPCDS